MPRRNKDRPSRKERDERIRRLRADDPFNGDREALIEHLIARLQRHAEALGPEELLRRVRERGLEPRLTARQLLEDLA